MRRDAPECLGRTQPQHTRQTVKVRQSADVLVVPNPFWSPTTVEASVWVFLAGLWGIMRLRMLRLVNRSGFKFWQPLLRLFRVYNSRRKAWTVVERAFSLQSMRAPWRECGELMLSHVTLEERFLDAKRRHGHKLAKPIVGPMHYPGVLIAGKRQAIRDICGRRTHELQARYWHLNCMSPSPRLNMLISGSPLKLALFLGISVISCSRDHDERRDGLAAHQAGREAYRAAQAAKRDVKEAERELRNASKEFREGWNEAKQEKASGRKK
jgi:hypothetical protein